MKKCLMKKIIFFYIQKKNVKQIASKVQRLRKKHVKDIKIFLKKKKTKIEKKFEIDTKMSLKKKSKNYVCEENSI